MNRRLVVAVLALSSVALIAAACGSKSSSSSDSSTTVSSSQSSNGASSAGLSTWVGSLCSSITPSADALAAAAKTAQTSGNPSDISALLESTSALLKAVSTEIVTLGAPPIDGGAAVVADYPKGIAQAIATVNSASASVKAGTISSVDQIGSIDVNAGVSADAKQAWAKVETEMGNNPKCAALKAALA